MITDPKEQKEFYAIPDEVTTPEEYKTWFNDTFIRKDKINVDKALRQQISGAALGTEMTNFFRFFKDRGVEFTEEEKKAFMDLPSHKNEKLIESGFEKLTGTYANQIEELKKTGVQNNDEKLKTLEEDKNKLSLRIKEIELARTQAVTELENEKKNTQTNLRTFKISSLRDEALKGVKLKAKLTEAERLGWESAIEKNLKFDLGENEALETLNPNGERIINKNKAGQFLNATEALQDLANTLGLAETNPHGGKPAPQPYTGNPKPGTREPAEPTGQTILLHGQVVKV